jgi:hypothetical protein
MMFYNACITGGVGIVKAKLMYAAVYAGGPRWETKWIKTGPGDKIEEFTIQQSADAPKDKFEDIARWIEANNPDLKKIRDTLNTIIMVSNN